MSSLNSGSTHSPLIDSREEVPQTPFIKRRERIEAPNQKGGVPVTSKGFLAIAASTFVLTVWFMPNALAQCGQPAKLVHPASWHPQDGNVHLMRAALSSAQVDGDEQYGAAIVGMWHVTFTAKTMNGASIPDTVIDNALVVWHSDKTEIMNSGRPPQDGDFCMGVWEHTRNSNKYKLNHFAWGGNAFPTDPPTEIGPPAGPTHIVEEVTLSPDGDHYTGPFTLDAYDTSGNTSTV